MVFQEYALFPWKTTQANVECGLRLKGIDKDKRAQIARRFIDLVGLKGFENKFPHQLSGGMRQRAAVTRALANEPALLLMDEPFAAVDALTRQRLQEELTAIIQAAHMTVVFVTHSIDEAVFLGDRVIVLSDRPGQIVGDLRIDLERPRKWAALADNPRFARYRDELNGLIHGAHSHGGITYERYCDKAAAENEPQNRTVPDGGSSPIRMWRRGLAVTVLAQHLATRSLSVADRRVLGIFRRLPFRRFIEGPRHQYDQSRLGIFCRRYRGGPIGLLDGT